MSTRVLTVVVVGVGALAGAIALVAAPAAALSAAVLGVVTGVLGAGGVCNARPPGTAPPTRAAWRVGLLAGGAVACGSLVLTGLVLLLGSASGPVLLLLVVVTASVWWWRRSRSSAGAPAVASWRVGLNRLLRAEQTSDPPRPIAGEAVSRVGPAEPPARPAAPAPADLSTPQLCLAWQRTYFALLDPPTAVPHSEVVALRGRLLDEIERRDPHGFTRWLDAGARAGSDPGRYLAGGGR